MGFSLAGHPHSEALHPRLNSLDNPPGTCRMVGVMKKIYQTLVVSQDPYDFQAKCDRLLEEGWKVIPESIRAGVAVAAVDKRTETRNHFIAFFEQIVNE